MATTCHSPRFWQSNSALWGGWDCVCPIQKVWLVLKFCVVRSKSWLVLKFHSIVLNIIIYAHLGSVCIGGGGHSREPCQSTNWF